METIGVQSVTGNSSIGSVVVIAKMNLEGMRIQIIRSCTEKRASSFYLSPYPSPRIAT